MPIQIGERTLATARPSDLDARLIASTGCSAAEHVDMLGRAATPFQIARALKPFLTDGDAPSIEELAETIAAGSASETCAATVALLSAVTVTAPAAAPVPAAPRAA